MAAAVPCHTMEKNPSWARLYTSELLITSLVESRQQFLNTSHIVLMPPIGCLLVLEGYGLVTAVLQTELMVRDKLRSLVLPVWYARALIGAISLFRCQHGLFVP
jgi:hypothetical protein